MKKKLTAVLSVILILSLCLAFAACGEKAEEASDNKEAQAAETEAVSAEPGVKIGDTFPFEDNEIKLTEIEDGASLFSDAGTATGKWVTLKFAFVGDGGIKIESEGFSIDGKDAVNAIGTMTGDGMILAVLFDVDKDADLNNLHLKVD